GHKDFQSFALPTELWHLATRDVPWFCDAKVGILFELTKSFCRFFLLYVAGYLWKSGVNLLNELVLKG
ncbi:hypothetical protein, partial [Muribaculum intestinale]|uniref:hypothetical protein n=1 Tax=Muribaculum intestinale TaxID=1796646 RepID=UPI0025A543BD